jgi:hypothetical protein
MKIAVPADDWSIFRTMSAASLVDLSQRLDRRKYVKDPRGPKRKQPKKISGKRNHHVSTGRLLATRK